LNLQIQSVKSLAFRIHEIAYVFGGPSEKNVSLY